MASPASNWKKDFSLQKYLNRFDLHIAETKIFLFAKRPFYHCNQRQMLKKAAKFAKRARSEIRFVEFNKGDGIPWNDGMAV